MANECVFCRIVRGELPAQPVHRDDRVVVIRDIHPKAPVHLLFLPAEHFTSPQAERAGVLGHMMGLAGEMARRHGVEETGYRLVVNQGSNGRQEIAHFHMHLLGGRRLGAMG